VSDDQETELDLARRAAQTMYLTYSEDEDAASLRARARAAWAREFGENSGAIVPPWLGEILNEGRPATKPKFFEAAPAAPPPGSWSNR
jgi:hypothetical protein